MPERRLRLQCSFDFLSMKISRIKDSLHLTLSRDEATLFLIFMSTSTATDYPDRLGIYMARNEFMRSAKVILDEIEDDMSDLYSPRKSSLLGKRLGNKISLKSNR